MKRILFSVLVVTVILASMVQAPGCANIIPPQGGPRDSLPPLLLSATPADSTTNFRGSRIELDFDEFVDLREMQQNVIWSPTFETPPPISVKLRTITINFARTQLEPNTTYTIQFGNALRDFNEGNVLRNFTYTFSTGPVLDSLQLAGKVLMAETGRPDSTLIVVLHNNLDDSAVNKRRPQYITRLDSAGNFRFRNLPPGRFAIYALSGSGGRRYSPSLPFAFADAPVNLPGAPPITLYAFQTVKTQEATAPAPRPSATDRRIRYTTNQAGNRQELGSDLVFSFERPLRLYDSSRIGLFTDSTFIPVPDYTTILDTTRKLLRVRTPWLPDTLYRLVLQQDFAEDTLGRRLLKADTLSFRTKARSDYGTVNLRIRNIDGENAVVQFVQNNDVKFSAPIRSGVFTSSLFLPGDYELRILYDRNNNGVWDPGDFFGSRKQPEIVRPIGRRITVKPALENAFDISL